MVWLTIHAILSTTTKVQTIYIWHNQNVNHIQNGNLSRWTTRNKDFGQNKFKLGLQHDIRKILIMVKCVINARGWV